MTAMTYAAQRDGYDALLFVKLGMADDAYRYAVAAFRAANCTLPAEPTGCEACGYPTDDLTEVPDLDPSVGYDATLRVCRGCLDGTVHQPRLTPYPQDEPTWAGVLSASEVEAICPF